jgi:hypothetical protein
MGRLGSRQRSRATAGRERVDVQIAGKYRLRADQIEEDQEEPVLG